MPKRVKRTGGPERPNYAGMRKQELHAAIENAPDVATLDEIDAELKRLGWSEKGQMRMRIAELCQAPDALPAVVRTFSSKE